MDESAAPRPEYYTPFYCEENVWRLCQEPRFADADARVVFISNADRTCALWSQRAAPQPGLPVVWDYHVVLLARAPRPRWRVWDLDSTLPFPIDAAEYLRRTFPAGDALDEVLPPRFRVIDAREFVATFASDRSHMRTADGGWAAPPPAHPPIRTATDAMNLPRFVDVTEPFVGERMDLSALRAWLASH